MAGAAVAVAAYVTSSASANISFRGVGCASATRCIAVGSASFRKGQISEFLPLAELWAGGHWQVTPTPVLATHTDWKLDSVACPSVSRCVAVGSIDNLLKNRTYSEIWNGKVWTLQLMASPQFFSPDDYTGVSCPSMTMCMAIGQGTPGEGAPASVQKASAIAESWNGTRWKISQLLDGFIPQGVSCASASMCVAVGVTASTHQVIEMWNGTRWTSLHPAEPAHASTENLYGVSCTSPAACVAVGTYENSQTYAVPHAYTLIERWNGHQWALQPDLYRYGTIDILQLNAVSCTSTSVCRAVGMYKCTNTLKCQQRNTLSNPQPIFSPLWPLTEEWDGKAWISEPPPKLPGTCNPNLPQAVCYPTVGGELFSVSCASPKACVAVGTVSQGPLLEPSIDVSGQWNGHRWSYHPMPVITTKTVLTTAAKAATSAPAHTAPPPAGSAKALIAAEQKVDKILAGANYRSLLARYVSSSLPAACRSSLAAQEDQVHNTMKQVEAQSPGAGPMTIKYTGTTIHKGKGQVQEELLQGGSEVSYGDGALFSNSWYYVLQGGSWKLSSTC